MEVSPYFLQKLNESLNHLDKSLLAGQEGFEPPTPGFGVRCSTNWSYWPPNRPVLLRFRSLVGDFGDDSRPNGPTTLTDGELQPLVHSDR